MKKANLVTFLIIAVLFLTGTKLICDYYSLHNSYIETIKYITEPLTTATTNPSLAFDSFEPEEYLDNSINQIFTNTYDAIKYRLSLPLGISALISGFTALFSEKRLLIS